MNSKKITDQQANAFQINASLNIGYEREKQEDYFQYKELDENHLLCIIADGTGSAKSCPQPAAIAVTDIIEDVEMITDENKDMFYSYPEFFLKLAMQNANRVLGGFKMGNEELFFGYAASVTCCLLEREDKGNRLYIAHAGNTRLYLMRDGILRQLTSDHTKGAELMAAGEINEETYYAHPDRLKMTSGIGVVSTPEIQTLSGKFRNTDVILMTTDGVHYSVRPEAMAQIILSSTADDASKNLIRAAKSQSYPDNYAAAIAFANIAVESPK